MINGGIENSIIKAKAEEVSQIIIDRNVNGMLWETVFEKYGIYGSVRQNKIKDIVNEVEKFINLTYSE